MTTDYLVNGGPLRALPIVMSLLGGLLFSGLTAPAYAAEKAPDAAAPEKAPPRKAKPIDPSLVPITDDPALPRVLLIGDSISMGYTLPVREMLKGKANVHHPPVNCGDSARGVKSLAAWLGEGKWDVIHLNFGLHDLKYLDEAGRYVTPDKGKQVASPEQYQKNLREVVARLKQSGAKVIWATTTPVPEGSAGRVKGDEVIYNKAAALVMAKNQIPINDLCAVAEKDLAKYQLPKNVHFSPAGSQALAQAVAASVAAALPPQP